MNLKKSASLLAAFLLGTGAGAGGWYFAFDLPYHIEIEAAVERAYEEGLGDRFEEALDGADTPAGWGPGTFNPPVSVQAAAEHAEVHPYTFTLNEFVVNERDGLSSLQAEGRSHAGVAEWTEENDWAADGRSSLRSKGHSLEWVSDDGTTSPYYTENPGVGLIGSAIFAGAPDDLFTQVVHGGSNWRQIGPNRYSGEITYDSAWDGGLPYQVDWFIHEEPERPEGKTSGEILADAKAEHRDGFDFGAAGPTVRFVVELDGEGRFDTITFQGRGESVLSYTWER